MCSSSLQLAPESRDLSQAEKKIVVMSPSWNFPARAELGHFNFQAETELDFF